MEVEIIPGQETSAVLALRAGGRLSLSVIAPGEGSPGQTSTISPALASTPGGNPLTDGSSGALILLRRNGDALPTVWEGRLLEPGSYRLTASRPGYRSTERGLVIEARRTTELEISLEPD